MRKTADVIELKDNNTARIMLYKHKKCKGCGYCNKTIHPGSIIEAANDAGAEKDDKVSVNIRKKINILEIVTTYILPTVMFFAGLLAGGELMKLGGPDFLGILMGLLFLVLAIALYFKTKHRFLPQYSAKIVKVIAKKDKGGSTNVKLA